MKKQCFTGWIAIALALASCIFTILNGRICFNDVNNVIAALGILVSVLIGWQIYNIIRLRDIHETQKKTESHVKEVSSELTRLEADTLLIHLGAMADAKNWNAVLRLAILIFKPLDKLDGVEDYYSSLAELIKRIYNENEISGELTEALLTSMEENLENSKYVRDLYVWVKTTARPTL